MFFWQNHIVGAELLRLWRATTGFALLEARQALSGGSLTVPDIPEKWWHGFIPLPSLLVCVRVRSCAYICVLEKRKWRRQIPPKKVKPEHAVVVAMLIIYFFKLFFLFTIVLPSKSNISSAFHMYLFTFYGSFCSIPLLLLLRWGLFTINLLVFLFTEQFLIHTYTLSSLCCG